MRPVLDGYKIADIDRVRVLCSDTNSRGTLYSPMPCQWTGYRRNTTRSLDRPCPACGGQIEVDPRHLVPKDS